MIVLYQGYLLLRRPMREAEMENRAGATALAPEKPRFDPASPAHRAFEVAARAAGMEPASPWIGGYAEYEWTHLRPLLQAYGFVPAARDVLEFGCNAGGSSVVLTALGARLTGVDVDAGAVRVAAANLERHGLGGSAQILHLPDTRHMPFAAGSFDFILANSVLEYVDPDHLDAVMVELHRLLRAGGAMLICGTASRLAPREIHSRRWLVNYLPRWADKWTGRPLQRGLSPRLLARTIRGRFVDATGRYWLEGRRAIHGAPSVSMRILDALVRPTGRSPGWVAPHIEMLLRKP